MVLDEAIFERAVEYLKEVEKPMPRTFEGMGRADTAELQMEIYRFIEAKQPVKHKELIARFRQDVDRVQQISEILNLFLSGGLISIQRDAEGNSMYKAKTK